jgi:hypothetical protein
MAKLEHIVERRSFLRNMTLGLIGAGVCLTVPGTGLAHNKSCKPMSDMYGNTSDMYGNVFFTCEERVSRNIEENAITLDELSTVQEESYWCWAASVEMLFSHYGYRLPQRDIVRQVWKEELNRPVLEGRMKRLLNKTWTDADGKRLKVDGTFFHRSGSLEWNLDMVKKASEEIRKDHPLLIGTMNHMMVLVGMTYVEVANAYSGDRKIYEVLSAQAIDPLNGEERDLDIYEWNNQDFLVKVRIEKSYDAPVEETPSDVPSPPAGDVIPVVEI